MKRVLIVRNGAYGDIIHVSHLPRLLKDQGWEFVGLATGWKGQSLLKNNPFIDALHFYENGGRQVHDDYFKGWVRVHSQLYDKTIDLNHTLETNKLALEIQNFYYQDQKMRDKYGKGSYYDVATCLAGHPELCGKYNGEIFYSDEEVKIVENDLLRPGRFKDNFKVMVNLAGSGPHKVFIQAKEVAKRILEKYPDAIIFTTGIDIIKELDFETIDTRIRSLVGKKNFRQALLMAKYMDCVIGCESGIMCGASMWDVPTIQLMTAASIENHAKYSKKDYSLQSPARCSPCFKGPYKYYGCPKKDNLPLCVYFDVDLIMKQVDKVYEEQYLLSKTS